MRAFSQAHSPAPHQVQWRVYCAFTCPLRRATTNPESSRFSKNRNSFCHSFESARTITSFISMHDKICDRGKTAIHCAGCWANPGRAGGIRPPIRAMAGLLATTKCCFLTLTILYSMLTMLCFTPETSSSTGTWLPTALPCPVLRGGGQKRPRAGESQKGSEKLQRGIPKHSTIVLPNCISKSLAGEVESELAKLDFSLLTNDCAQAFHVEILGNSKYPALVRLTETLTAAMQNCSSNPVAGSAGVLQHDGGGTQLTEPSGKKQRQFGGGDSNNVEEAGEHAGRRGAEGERGQCGNAEGLGVLGQVEVVVLRRNCYRLYSRGGSFLGHRPPTHEVCHAFLCQGVCAERVSKIHRPRTRGILEMLPGASVNLVGFFGFGLSTRSGLDGMVETRFVGFQKLDTFQRRKKNPSRVVLHYPT